MMISIQKIILGMNFSGKMNFLHSRRAVMFLKISSFLINQVLFSLHSKSVTHRIFALIEELFLVSTRVGSQGSPSMGHRWTIAFPSMVRRPFCHGPSNGPC